MVAALAFVLGPLACKSRGALSGAGGSIGTLGDAAAGTSGGGAGGNASGGASGGALGGGGAGAADAGSDAPITTCPASRPTVGSACAAALGCTYTDVCNCHGCCTTTYDCFAGQVRYFRNDNGCMQGTPCPADAGADGAGAVCTPGQDQTCNDNPIISSLRGRCTDAGVCQCYGDAAVNPDSGRCP
ncbi:MAG TPA: hypothetical protein VIF57_32220 [Polyangia bacterium]